MRMVSSDKSSVILFLCRMLIGCLWRYLAVNGLLKRKQGLS